MPTYEITSPDGAKWEVTAPDGASEAQVLEYAKSQWSSSKPVTRAERPSPAPVGAMDRANAAITGANRGIAGIFGLPMDTVENVYNLAKAGVGTHVVNVTVPSRWLRSPFIALRRR